MGFPSVPTFNVICERSSHRRGSSMFLRRSLVLVMILGLLIPLSAQPASAQEPAPILVYTGHDSYNQGYTTFGQAVGRTVIEQATLPADLSEYGCVILPVNRSTFASEHIEQFAAYVVGGGRLFALGEAGYLPGIPEANANMNAIASELQSGLMIIGAEIDFNPHVTTNIVPTPFTTGVNSLVYGYTSEISASGAGQIVARTQGAEGVPFIGAQLIGAGILILSGDANPFSDLISYEFGDHDNEQLFDNLCNGIYDPPLQVTVDGVTDGAIYQFGMVPTATCLIEDDENQEQSFPATLSAITGPQAALGLGSQTAACSYTDDVGFTVSASVTYSIVDTTDPVISPLPDLVVPATSPAGVTVSWSATAEDAVEGTVDLDCTPPSGSFFSIPTPRSDATTMVNCSATDSSGNTANDSFTVTVLGADSQLDLLQAGVQESSIHRNARTTLDRALASAETGLNRNQLPTSCFQLSYFQTQVNLYRALSQIPSEQANEWLASAARIKAVLGC